jgi:starvation-inducible DNA-binding protein
MQYEHTRNGLHAHARQVSTSVLNAGLVDAIDLALLTKQAHWNIKGPHFIALHGMFDRFRAELDTHIDAMAERVVQLGGTALGTVQVVSRTTRLAPYPIEIRAERAHLDALLARYAHVADAVRAAIDQITSAGDANTADLLTDFSRKLDEMVWFLEAHLFQDAARRPGVEPPLTRFERRSALKSTGVPA